MCCCVLSVSLSEDQLLGSFPPLLGRQDDPYTFLSLQLFTCVLKSQHPLQRFSQSFRSPALFIRWYCILYPFLGTYLHICHSRYPVFFWQSLFILTGFVPAVGKYMRRFTSFASVSASFNPRWSPSRLSLSIECFFLPQK